MKRERLFINKILIEKEKEELELTDKQISIQGKRIENKKAESDLEDSRDLKKIEAERLANDKIFSLVIALIASAIDENRTILGSEPFYEPVLKGRRRDKALDKLIELIAKL